MTIHIFGYDHYFNKPTHDTVECTSKNADIELAKNNIEHQHGDMCWTLDKITFEDEEN